MTTQSSTLNLVTLTTTAGDIALPFVECVIVEAINNEFMFGHITIHDTAALSHVLNGEQNVEINFKTELDNQVLNKKFIIYSKTPETIEMNGQRAYKLLIVSREALTAGGVTICRKFNQPIGQIVRNIFTHDIGISDGKTLTCQINTPSYSYIAPNIKAIEVLRTLKDKAVTTQGSPFVLFENAVGFNFVSIDQLLSDYNTKDLFLYNVENVSNGSLNRHPTRKAVSIDRVQVFHSFDSINVLNNGGFSTTIGQYEPLTKTYTRSITKMPSQNQYAYSPYTASFIKEVAGADNQTKYELAVVANSYDKYLSANKGKLNTNASIINNFSIQFSQTNTSYMHRAGDCVELEFDRALSITDQGTGETIPNQRLNGRFLISKVVHIFSTTPGFQYTGLIEATKAGFEVPIE